MLTNRTYRENVDKWQPCAAMYRTVSSLGLTVTATNNFGGNIGRGMSIDSRQLKQ